MKMDGDALFKHKSFGDKALSPSRIFILQVDNVTTLSFHKT